MLRIIQNQSSQSAKSYYSHAEYYGEGQELSGQWHGKLAETLGLAGEIRQCDFDALCDNLHPQTQQPLTPRNDKNRTVGYDFNWHAPKGLSLAYVMGDDRIAEVFDQAVTQTMRDIEQEAKTRVRVNGRNGERTTSNLIWGQFLHTTARPVDGEIDPHLHAHCFTFNCTKDDEENRIKAAQFRDLKRDARFWEAKFHARLAKGVREELGYDIERRGGYWDVNVPDEIKRKFSRRSELINAIAEREGIVAPEEKGEIGSMTRESKVNELSFRELQESWRGRMTNEELHTIERAIHTEGTPGAIVNIGPSTIAEAMHLAIVHCFERDAVVPERKLLEEALRFGVGEVDVDEIEAEAKKQGVITREVNGRRVSTTPEVLKDEQDVIEFARQGKFEAMPFNPNWRPKDAWLSEEQLSAVDELVNSRSRVQLILGGAGTGKTTLMTTAVSAIEEGGHKVLTFAPSAEASRGVLRSEGFDNATTVAELLVNEKLQDAVEGNVIWVDEVGLLGSRQLKKLFDLAEKKHSRVILSGDWQRQHGSVDRGGILGLLDHYAGVTPIQINTIRRQQGKYKDAIASIAAGDVLNGFDQLDQLGWVHELDDSQRDKQLARDYADSIDQNRSALVVSPTHKEAEHLTNELRAELRHRGHITGEEREVLSLKPVYLTEGERSSSAYLNNDDVIIFQQNAKGYTKGDRIKITPDLPKTVLDQAARYAVYRRDSISLAKGDKIRLTAGGKTKDGKHRLNNGATFTVNKVKQNGDIQLTNGWTIDAKFGHIAHGFVSTSHASQGRTVQDVFISESAESFAAASYQNFYVSASRGKLSARVYTNAKEELRSAIQTSSANMTASEVFWPTKQAELHTKQRQAAIEKENDAAKETELVHVR